MKHFTADTHFNHEKIAKVRGFECAASHDHCMLNNINHTVGQDDELFILGDFAWDKPGKYRLQIKCKNIRFVIGNHDKYEACKNVFGDIRSTISTRVYSANETSYGKAFLCHFPFAYWENSHHNSWHLYGHTHAAREETLDQAFPGRQAMDVGLDNINRLYGAFRPITEHEVFDYMSVLPGHDHVDWYEARRSWRGL